MTEYYAILYYNERLRDWDWLCNPDGMLVGKEGDVRYFESEKEAQDFLDDLIAKKHPIRRTDAMVSPKTPPSRMGALR